MVKASDLANAVMKQASVLVVEEVGANPDLQKMVGDPDDTVTSWDSQFKPNPGSMQLPNPLSPVEGDEVFFNYMVPGAAFQAHDGSEWVIEDYAWNGQVSIYNRWYPRVSPQVSVFDIRRSIYAWIDPVFQRVPAPPPGVNYDAQPVTISE